LASDEVLVPHRRRARVREVPAPGVFLGFELAPFAGFDFGLDFDFGFALDAACLRAATFEALAGSFGGASHPNSLSMARMFGRLPIRWVWGA
jgi:hypothetical protein